MPNCTLIDPLVTPFVDGELPPADRETVAQHLRACPPCQARIVVEQAIHHLLRERQAALKAKQAPNTLRARCASLDRSAPGVGGAPVDRSDRAVLRTPGRETRVVGTVPAAATRSWRARVGPLALAATLVLVVGGAFLYQLTGSSSRVMAAELTADHVKCFMMNAVLRTHDTPEVVESSMASGFDWPAHLPGQPEREGLELVGSRPCLYGEGFTAHVMYRHNGRPVSLFMLPGTSRSNEMIEVLGHQAAIWSVGNRTFVLVSRETPADADRMAAFIRASVK